MCRKAVNHSINCGSTPILLIVLFLLNGAHVKLFVLFAASLSVDD